MRGEDVRWVQRALIALNYYLGPWGPSGRGDDGIFGSKTNSNVRSYQGGYRDKYNRGLAVDGIVGPLTWGALGGAAVGVTPGASQPSSGNNSGSSSPSSGAGSGSVTAHPAPGSGNDGNITQGKVVISKVLRITGWKYGVGHRSKLLVWWSRFLLGNQEGDYVDVKWKIKNFNAVDSLWFIRSRVAAYNYNNKEIGSTGLVDTSANGTRIYPSSSTYYRIEPSNIAKLSKVALYSSLWWIPPKTGGSKWGVPYIGLQNILYNPFCH